MNEQESMQKFMQEFIEFRATMIERFNQTDLRSQERWEFHNKQSEENWKLIQEFIKEYTEKHAKLPCSSHSAQMKGLWTILIIVTTCLIKLAFV